MDQGVLTCECQYWAKDAVAFRGTFLPDAGKCPYQIENQGGMLVCMMRTQHVALQQGMIDSQLWFEGDFGETCEYCKLRKSIVVVGQVDLRCVCTRARAGKEAVSDSTFMRIAALGVSFSVLLNSF